MKKKKVLKLYVWEGFSPDYTDGLAVALAYSEKQARQLVIEDFGFEPSQWGTLEVLSARKPISFQVSGGG